jgi:hypothetical protein
MAGSKTKYVSLSIHVHHGLIPRGSHQIAVFTPINVGSIPLN